MWNGLDKLLELQGLDIQIAKLEAEARAIPAAIQALDAKLTTSRASLEAAKGKAEQLQKERRTKERELEEIGQNIKKKQARLFEIKTNEEYSAVLKEIETLKEKSSLLEEQIIVLLDQIDVVAKDLGGAEKEFQAAQGVSQKERAEKEAQLTGLQRDLAQLRESRKGQAGRIEQSLLQQYTRLLKGRGVAVVAVKDGSCSGCGISLTPQTFAEVRRNDRMFTCASCNRILYYAG
jgi:predicted  nucleic acid-binding Zn-ribbon protein